MSENTDPHVDIDKDEFTHFISNLNDKKINLSKKYYFKNFDHTERQPIKKQIEYEKQELENREKSQDIRLKKITLYILFTFLTVETIAIFTYAFLQGIEKNGFHLEEWSFKLLISATISQITIMLLIAVRHLFPNNKKLKNAFSGVF